LSIVIDVSDKEKPVPVIVIGAPGATLSGLTEMLGDPAWALGMSGDAPRSAAKKEESKRRVSVRNAAFLERGAADALRS